MTSYVQLLIFFLSFLYGFLSALFINFNIWFVRKSNFLFKLLSYILLCLILSFGYITILYFINSGIVHVYFYFIYLIGFKLFYNCKKVYKKV